MRIALLLLILPALSERPLMARVEGALPAREERIVFLGDSITDGHTLPLLVRQATGLACINAGVAGDTAAGMRKRIERDVLPRGPHRVALSVGINDVLRNVPPRDYEADVAAIADRLKRERIPLLLLTPTILGPKHADAEKALAGYIDALRRLAAKEGFAIAEVHARMAEARAAGRDLLEADQVHLTFEGYRVMGRAVLDAMGRAELAVPGELVLEPMAGIVREWKIRALPDGGPKTLTLPQAAPAAHWWFDQERRRGFAVELEKVAGPGKRYQATATVDSSAPRDVFFNTGADLGAIRLNGKLLWKSEGWTGWHAGKERIAARLDAGPNTIDIDSGGSFFLSITGENSW